jgi:hypothetical protein
MERLSSEGWAGSSPLSAALSIFLSVSFLSLSFLSLFLITNPSVATAEFLKTRPDVFQTTDGRGKVITSRADRGLFVSFGQPVDVQLFNPEDLPAESTEHVFISYDAALNGYTKLTFGKHKSYRIIGSLTFVIGNLRVAIDNVHGYASIAEIDGSGDSIGILGFRGVEPVARYKGVGAVALLEANQLESYRKVIKNFRYENHALTLNGNPIESASVGLAFDPPTNPCIPGKDKVFLVPSEVKKIRAIMNQKERLGYLEKILKAQRKASPLDALILIRIESTNAYAIDLERGSVTTVKPFSEARDNQICVLEDVPMS